MLPERLSNELCSLRPNEDKCTFSAHDLPDPDRVADFGKFAAELGFKMTLDTPRQIADSFNGLAKAARENEGLRLLEPIAIRTMAKAIYTTENIGHYGLGFENYSHFTSPIRRYADVLAHRLLQKNLGEKAHRENKEDLEAKCKHISAQERKAMTAERESIKYKQVEFISKHIGEEMEGHISGMIDRGLFIELAGSKAEGLIGFDKLNDAYDIDESRLKATGRRSKNRKGAETQRFFYVYTFKRMNFMKNHLIREMTGGQINFAGPWLFYCMSQTAFIR